RAQTLGNKGVQFARTPSQVLATPAERSVEVVQVRTAEVCAPGLQHRVAQIDDFQRLHDLLLLPVSLLTPQGGTGHPVTRSPRESAAAPDQKRLDSFRYQKRCLRSPWEPSKPLDQSTSANGGSTFRTLSAPALNSNPCQSDASPTISVMSNAICAST